MAAIERNVRTWERGIIPFLISSEFVQGSDEFTQIALAINEYNLKTNIRFVPRTVESDYIVFRNGSAGWCSSYVGKQGGEQSINCYLVGRQYSAGNLIHEIMHMIGFHHEHQRTDRDQFVLVDFSNVKRTFDFEKVAGENLTEYDYGSIMHYPRLITNTNLINDPKRDTIIPLKSLDFETILGQRGRLSQKDIEGINTLYPVVANVKPFIFDTPGTAEATNRIVILVAVFLLTAVLIRKLLAN